MFAIIAAILIAAPFGVSVGATNLVEERLEPRKTGASECTTDDIVRRLGHQSGLFEFTEEPDAGSWQTWFVSPDEIEVPAPPASGSPQDLLELAEVRLAVANRTSEQALLSELYGQNPAGAYLTSLYLNLIVLHADKYASKNPPRLARQMAIFETALFDAFVTVWHYKYCYLRAAPSAIDPTIDTIVDVPPAPSYPSEHAAAVGVIAAVFPAFFPCHDPNNNLTCEERPEFWERLSYDATESRLWAGANYRSDIEVGFDIGHEIGQRVLAARDSDGWDAQWDGTGWPQGDCNWKRNPLGHGGRGPVEVMWGQVTPFAMTHGAQFRAPPPPACDSPSYKAQYQDLFDASLTLTKRQTDISDYWEAGAGTVTPPGMNLEIALKKSLEYELNTLRAQRVLAYVSVAVADAAIAAWDTKFTYWWDRPIQAIRRLGLDVAAGLCEDGIQEDYIYGGCWESRAVTPPFPGYVSGHSTFTGAGMETLKYFFPDDWLEFNACQTEAAMARFYGGIHFRADNDVGVEMGRAIGHLLWERAANDGADQ
jgi:hypothetical protein